MLATRLIYSVATLGLGLFFTILFKKIVDLVFSRIGRRGATIRSLLKNIIEVTIFLIAFLIILSHWGFNIVPILTGAGILGLAISFGAQTLIKDVINGFFILAEDQYNVGDWVKIDKWEGEVYRLTLRLTILKDKKENLIYIPNSQVMTVVKLKED